MSPWPSGVGGKALAKSDFIVSSRRARLGGHASLIYGEVAAARLNLWSENPAGEGQISDNRAVRESSWSKPPSTCSRPVRRWQQRIAGRWAPRSERIVRERPRAEKWLRGKVPRAMEARSFEAYPSLRFGERCDSDVLADSDV